MQGPALKTHQTRVARSGQQYKATRGNGRKWKNNDKTHAGLHFIIMGSEQSSTKPAIKPPPCPDSTWLTYSKCPSDAIVSSEVDNPQLGDSHLLSPQGESWSHPLQHSRSFFLSPRQLPCIPGSPDSSSPTAKGMKREHSKGPQGCPPGKNPHRAAPAPAEEQGLHLSPSSHRGKAVSTSGKPDRLRQVRTHAGLTRHTATSWNFSSSIPHKRYVENFLCQNLGKVLGTLEQQKTNFLSGKSSSFGSKKAKMSRFVK